MSSPTGPNYNVCEDQNKFNKALNKALVKADEDLIEKKSGVFFLYGILYFILMILAVILAMKTPAGEQRIVHLLLALVFSPIYVFCYYLQELLK